MEDRPLKHARRRGGPPLTGLKELLDAEKRLAIRPISAPSALDDGRATRANVAPQRVSVEFRVKDELFSSPPAGQSTPTYGKAPTSRLPLATATAFPYQKQRQNRLIDDLMQEVREVTEKEDQDPSGNAAAALPDHKQQLDILTATRLVGNYPQKPPGQDTVDLLRKLSRTSIPRARQPDSAFAVKPVPRKHDRELKSAIDRIMARDSNRSPESMQTKQEHTSRELEHPRSALEAVLHEHKSEFGDSTVASLENIINPETDPTNSSIIDANAAPKKEEDHAEAKTNLTQVEKDQRQEELALESLNNRLRSTRTTIKDANRGLRRIENRIEAGEAVETKPQAAKEVPSRTSTTELKMEPAKMSDLEHKIAAAAATQPDSGGQPLTEEQVRAIVQAVLAAQTAQAAPTPGNVRLAPAVPEHICSRPGLWSTFWNNFGFYDVHNRWQMQLTWIGLFMVLWWAWFFLELAVCTAICDRQRGPILGFATIYVILIKIFPILRDDYLLVRGYYDPWPNRISRAINAKRLGLW